MTEDTSVQTYVLKMIDLITRLGWLDFAMDGELSQNLIRQSLPDFFFQFVINYHVNKLNTSLPELLNMLKIAESHFKGEKAQVFILIRSARRRRRKILRKS